MLRTVRAVAGGVFVCAFLAGPLFAAAPVFTNNFVSVTLDGVRLGTDTDPSNYSMFPSVVYDPSSGLFHLWVASSNALSIEGLRHATSSDGVHFVSDGNLSFAGGSPFPIYGAATEPQFEFPRAARIGDDWKLLIWTENAQTPGQYGDYNYNESVNDVGVDPSTLAVAHQGPVYPTNGTGTFGQTTGPWGIVNGKLYVADDRPGGMSKWEYDDTTPPAVTPPAGVFQDLITGTGYVYFLTHPGNPLAVYVHNVGRVLDQGDATLGAYYSLRHPDGTRVNKQIYYVQSGDGGQTWSAPVGIFGNGDAVRVDGAPNTFDFSHPEVTLVGSRRILYFSTKAADGAYVVATSAAQPPQPGSWADIVGSGAGPGERAHSVIRTSDGGYAVLATNFGFPTNGASFWLLRLDGSGEIVSQNLYVNDFLPAAGFDAAAVVEDPYEGGLVMAGSYATPGNPMWVLKVDSGGLGVWSSTLLTCDAGNCGNSVHAFIPASGGYAFAGTVAGSTGTFAVGSLTADGTLAWLRQYPTDAGASTAVSLADTGDGLAVGGNLVRGPNDSDFRLLKVGYDGQSVSWDQGLGTSGNELLFGVASVVPQGFVLAAGSGPGGATAAYLDNHSGDVQVQKSYSGNFLGYATAITPMSSGIGIAGFGTGGGLQRAFLLQTDMNGAPQWARAFAALPSSLASFDAVQTTFDDGLLGVGADTVQSNDRALMVRVGPGGEFVGCLDVEVSIPVTVGDPGLTVTPLTSTVVDETANTTVGRSFDGPGPSPTDAAQRIVCRAALPAELAPIALAADPSGNGVADPGERFVVAPTWENDGLVATALTGHTSAISDSNGLDTTDPDLDAGYGAVASLASSDCLTATGDCYQFGFQNIARPSQHWDTTFDETLSTSDPHHRWAKRWIVHAGLSFSDVSPASGFYPFIEDIFHNGITGGCGAGIYCPANSVTRAQMSVFLLKSKHGASFVPPPCAGIFGDVPCPGLFADWIEELYAEGITGGCSASPLLYCPDDSVTRQQMSAFLLKSLNGSGYVPPACAGLFGDVTCPGLFADWIEDLYNRQITAGCGTSPLLYCPTAPNTRQQMAVFLTKTFSLVLYGP